MKVKDFKKIISSVPEDFSVAFRDVNFGGVGKYLDEYSIDINKEKGVVLLDPPSNIPIDCEV